MIFLNKKFTTTQDMESTIFIFQRKSTFRYSNKKHLKFLVDSENLQCTGCLSKENLTTTCKAFRHNRVYM